MAPSVTAPANQTIPEDTATAALAVALSDADADTLTLSASSGNLAIIPASGLVLGGSGNSRTITVTPLTNANGGPVTITLTVSDGFMSATATFTVTVTAVDDPPVALGGQASTTMDVAIGGALQGYDPEGQALTFALGSGPSNGTLSTPISPTTGAFVYTPGASFVGADSFTFTVTANSLTSPAATVLIYVGSDPNGIRPLISSTPDDEVVQQGTAWTYNVQLDTSRYLGFVPSSFNYSLVGAPGSLTIDATGHITGNVSSAGNNHVRFGILVKEPLAGGTDFQQVVLRLVTVSATN